MVLLPLRIEFQGVKMKQDNNDAFQNQFPQDLNSYRDLLYNHHRQQQERQQQQQQRRQQQQLQQQKQSERLSLPSDDSSPDWSTTTSSNHNNDDNDIDTVDEENQYDENQSSLEQITDFERHQIETFFKGLKTEVYVCNSLANLYFKSINDNEWQLHYTGIPVIVLNIGETRSRDKRQIQIVLAERGTGFMLWHDIIDNLSNYQVANTAFHIMHYSMDHTKQIGISFNNSLAANHMWQHVDKLISCPENISLSMPGKKKTKRKQLKQQQRLPLPLKCEISQPCCFEHVIQVEKNDTNRFYSFQEYLPKSVTNLRINESIPND